ncbi:MAG: branched-chain amino acid ABC transporter permease [Oscillibacter sp.]|jgi:branched-chain amino acid transport system permease protein|nr:branched-chain amino acid ABC transporter permease [Oscillibacter sp.]
MKNNKLRPYIIAGLIAIAAYMVLLFGSDGGYLSNFIVYVCLFIIASQGWNLLGGYVGEISFGHAVFWGIGAYTVGLPIGYDLNISPLLLAFAGAAVAALFAWIISYPLLRVRGFPFLVGTYGLGVVFEKVFVASPKLFATKGVFVANDLNRFFLHGMIFVLMIVVTVGVKWLTDKDLGLRFKAVRDVPEAAEMVGVNIYHTKTAALVIGAFLCGLAGGLYVLYSGFINPTTAFDSSVSISILMGPYIGGIGTVLGTVFGTSIVIAIQEWARSALPFTGGQHMALGLLLIIIMMVSREGLFPGLRKLALKLSGKTKDKTKEKKAA